MQGFDLAKARVQVYIDMAALDMELSRARMLIASRLPSVHVIKVVADMSQFNSAIGGIGRGGGGGGGDNLPTLYQTNGPNWRYAGATQPSGNQLNALQMNAQQNNWSAQRNSFIYNTQFSRENGNIRDEPRPTRFYTGTGTGFMAGMGYPLAFLGPQFALGYAGGRALTGAASYSVDTEQQLAKIRVIMGSSRGESMDFLRSIQGVGRQIPVDSSKLLDIAGIGARSGIEGDKLLAFTKSMAKIELAMPEFDVEELAEQMVRTLKLFGKTTDEIEGLASAMKGLDNATTASSKDIFLYTANIAGFANTIGLTASQTMAMSVLLRQTNLEPEMATSAMQRLLTYLVTRKEEMANAIGVKPEQMTAMFRKNPLEALGEVMKGLDKLTYSDEKIVFVKELLGLTNVRDVKAFTQTGDKWGAIPGLTALSDSEFASGETLGRSVDIYAETVTAKFTELTNAMKEMATDAMPVLLDSMRGFIELAKGVTVAAKDPGKAFIDQLNFSVETFFPESFGLKSWRLGNQQPRGRNNAGRMVPMMIPTEDPLNQWIPFAPSSASDSDSGGEKLPLKNMAAGMMTAGLMGVLKDIKPEFENVTKIGKAAIEDFAIRSTSVGSSDIGNVRMLESLNSLQRIAEISEQQREELQKINDKINFTNVLLERKFSGGFVVKE